MWTITLLEYIQEQNFSVTYSIQCTVHQCRTVLSCLLASALHGGQEGLESILQATNKYFLCQPRSGFGETGRCLRCQTAGLQLRHEWCVTLWCVTHCTVAHSRDELCVTLLYNVVMCDILWWTHGMSDAWRVTLWCGNFRYVLVFRQWQYSLAIAKWKDICLQHCFP